MHVEVQSAEGRVITHQESLHARTGETAQAGVCGKERVRDLERKRASMKAGVMQSERAGGKVQRRASLARLTLTCRGV